MITATATVSTSIRILGMSCGRCQQAVTAALASLPGISSIAVDLLSGTATVESKYLLDPMWIGFALDDAGFDSDLAA